MAIRSAPISGYDFGAKRDYRRKVWGRLLKSDEKNGLIGLMPSIEGDEVEYLIGKGIDTRRMVFIDRNPAIAATLSRRFHPARSYGCDVVDAINRMKKDGIALNALNLDLCGPVSPKLARTLAIVARTQVVVDKGSIAVTVMKGREHGRSWEFTQKFVGQTVWDCTQTFRRHSQGTVNLTTARAAAVFAMLTNPVRSGIRTSVVHPYYQGLMTGMGEYPSGHLRMVWVVIQLHRQPCLCDDCLFEWIYNNGGEVEGVTAQEFMESWYARLALLRVFFGSDAIDACIDSSMKTMGERLLVKARLREFYEMAKREKYLCPNATNPSATV